VDSTSSKLSKAAEIAANLSLTIVAIVGAGVLVRNYLLRPAPAPISNANEAAVSKPSTAEIQQSLEGAHLSIQGINWDESNETVLLALSNKCHFCSESAPFYQKLAQNLAARKDVRVIAVFPQTVDEAKKYLDGLGVPVADVRQASLGSIGVKGTPTLMIVDKTGTVKQAWMGRLSVERESEVLGRLKT
jgi:thiol-disulfide isomerase/thioredoxin